MFGTVNDTDFFYGFLLSINKACTTPEACSAIVLGDIVCALFVLIYFTIFLLYCGTVLTVWYICFSIVLWNCSDSVVYFVFHFFSIITILFRLFIVCICFCSFVFIFCLDVCLTILRGRRRRDRMVVGFTTTCAISAYNL